MAKKGTEEQYSTQQEDRKDQDPDEPLSHDDGHVHSDEEEFINAEIREHGNAANSTGSDSDLPFGIKEINLDPGESITVYGTEDFACPIMHPTETGAFTLSRTVTPV